MGDMADLAQMQEDDDFIDSHFSDLHYMTPYEKFESDQLSSIIIRTGNPNSKLNKKLDKIDEVAYAGIRTILKWGTATDEELFVRNMSNNHVLNSYNKLIRDKAPDRWIWALKQELKHRSLPIKE